jgi:hypothetical protein
MSGQRHVRSLYSGEIAAIPIEEDTGLSSQTGQDVKEKFESLPSIGI